ncbi:membrane-bound neuregulin protein vein isoform X2 [Arctopsyche grandis]|uniref:membrane-bound neuregulin protein vein isoform X2 n=1 Tax=Arctopsyche grandis TaxID=121162 RepID=UPI00406D9142
MPARPVAVWSRSRSWSWSWSWSWSGGRGRGRGRGLAFGQRVLVMVVVWAALAALAAPFPAPAAAAAPAAPRRCLKHQKQLVALAEGVQRAPLVLEARARSVSPDNVSVTFKVQRVLKGTAREELLRLQLPPQARRTLKMDGRYLLLLERAPTRALRLLDQPTPRGIARCLRIAPAKDVKVGDKLRLSCPSRGRNPSNLDWYKNDEVVKQTLPRIKLQLKKRQLNLVIVKVLLEDSGHYECRASGDERWLSRVDVTVRSDVTVRTDDTRSLGEPCPIPEPDVYCQNGGTCVFITNLNEAFCRCPEGYEGHRCEKKDVSNRGSMYPYHSYTCKLGLFLSYYC